MKEMEEIEMINKLYDNCFKTELSTKVLEVREEDGRYWHACKDTIFYKENGGMASDIGKIDEHLVEDLKFEDGYLWHLLDVKLEGIVFMSVNLHERFRKCQIHTAQHLISAVLGNVYQVETLSHHVGDEENDIEFSFQEFTEKMAFELQVLCNGLIRDDLDVSVQYPTSSEASKLSKIKDVHKDLRVVRIGALDYNLCGCMHVPSLRYLQMMYIRGFEKTKKGYKIKYVVGDQFLDCVSQRYKVLDEVGTSLALSHVYVDTGVHHLLNEIRQYHRDILLWRQKYNKLFIENINDSQGDVFVHYFDDMDVKSVVDLAQEVIKQKQKAVIFLAKIYNNAHFVVASHEEVAFDVCNVYDKLAVAYELKGGGNKTMSQGGGVYQEGMLEFAKELR